MWIKLPDGQEIRAVILEADSRNPLGSDLPSELGISKEMIQESLQQLEEVGLIEITKSRTWRETQYSLCGITGPEIVWFRYSGELGVAPIQPLSEASPEDLEVVTANADELEILQHMGYDNMIGLAKQLRAFGAKDWQVRDSATNELLGTVLARTEEGAVLAVMGAEGEQYGGVSFYLDRT